VWTELIKIKPRASATTQAKAGDLVRMPKRLPHAYYNKQDKQARALF
jgi:hypothetical protein